MRSIRGAFVTALVDTLAVPTRVLGSSLAVALGLAVAVAAYGLGATAQRQVAADFDVLRATEVRIREFGPGAIPNDYSERLEQVAGIQSVSRVGSFGQVDVASQPTDREDLGTTLAASLYGLDPGGSTALNATILGSALDIYGQQGDHAQVLIGGRLASQLNIGVLDGTRAVWISDRPYVVRGIVEDGGRLGGVTDGVVLLNSEAEKLVGPAEEWELVIATAPGAATMVASQAPTALRPEAPDALVAIAPPDPGQFRFQIESRVRLSLLAVAGVATIIGAMVIAHSMSMSVVARRSEIGLRRALGATGRDVFLQFAFEAVLIGLTGGLIGASLGIIGVVAISVVAGWNPIVDPLIPLAGALFGVILGAISGLAAAFRAARLAPIETLRLSA